MPTVRQNRFRGKSRKFAVLIRFDKGNANYTTLTDLVQSPMKLLFVVDADNDKVRVVVMRRDVTLAGQLNAGMSSLNNDLLRRQVFSDEKIDVVNSANVVNLVLVIY